MRLNRLSAALAAAAVTSAVAATTAFAHTEVKSTYPAKGKSASTRISTVSVTFTGTIRSGSIKVTGPGGNDRTRRAAAAVTRASVKRLRVPLKSVQARRQLQGELDDEGRRRPHPARHVHVQAQVRRPLVALAAAVARPRRRSPRPAAAHIQVRPALVAPGDPVLFEVLVPGERDAQTVEVTLQVPKDVLPFSFEDPPGWERTNKEAPTAASTSIRWRGKLAEDGFARFAFLGLDARAGGRDRLEGAADLRRRARSSRWIGAPDSENPARGHDASARPRRARTRAARAARRRPTAAAPATATAAAAAASAPAEDGDDSPLPLILGIAALVVSLAALALALRPRKAAAA